MSEAVAREADPCRADVIAPGIPVEGRPRANVLGVGVDAVSLSVAVERIVQAIDTRGPGYVCVTGVHGVMEARRDASLRRILNSAQLNVPDGMPMVWVGRAQGHATMDRVYGPDLMLALCERSVQAGYRHFLYGGVPRVAGELATSLRTRFRGLQVVGTYTPPFRPLTGLEADDLAARVTRCRPDIVWVGLSTPKQERFMASFYRRLGVPVMIGVGAAFDIHSGRVPQAPRWMQRRGLEWFFRLCAEPRRLFWRYARNNPAFVAAMLLQLSGLRTHRVDDSVSVGS